MFRIIPVTFNAAKRTTNLVSAADNYTCLGWVKPRNNGVTGSVVWLNVNGVATYDRYVAIYSDASDSYYLEIFDGTTVQQSTKIPFTVDYRIPFAYTRSGTSHKFYLDGVLVSTLTKDISTFGFTEEWIGGDTSVGNDVGMDLQGFREYKNRALTFAELIAEWNSAAAVVSTDLWVDAPLASDLLDDSGASHDFTAVNAATFVTSAVPVAITNTSSGTAAVITPGTEYIQVPITSTIAVETWWKFTADPVLVQVGIKAYSQTYAPRIKPYDGSLVPISGSQESQHNNYPFMIPVTPGASFYIRVRNVAASPGPGGLNLSVTNSLNQDVPIGSILVPSDIAGWNAALIDTASAILQYKAFPAGEATAVLDNGIILTVDDSVSGRMKLFSPQLVELLTIDSNYDKWITVSGDRTFFYVLSNITGSGQTGASVTTVNADGSFGPRTWILPGFVSGFQGMAVSPDDTILYWKDYDQKIVKRYDLVNDVPLTNLTSIIPNFKIGAREILCLTNGNILIPYYKPINNVNDSYFISYVGPDGVNIDNFAFTGSGIYATTSRLAYDIDDPNFFWVWYEIFDDATATDTNGIAAFLRIKISDGTIDTDIRARLFGTAGAFSEFTPTPDTEVLGPSESCSFVILRELIPAVGTTTGTIVVLKITDPSDDPTSFDFESDTLGPFSLVGGGSEIFDGLTPGVFDVAEVPNSDYQSTIEVSNGDDPSAITVGAGETITVTVRNYKLEPLSGLYILVKDKRHDTLYSSIQYPSGSDPTFTTENVKIPDPFADLYLAGDE